MRDIKEWINGTGISFAHAAWKKTPEYPYGVYLDETDSRGADEKLFIKDHDVNIEIYSDTEKGIACAEEKIEKFFNLNAVEHEYTGREWVEQEKCFRSSYYFRFTEKMEV